MSLVARKKKGGIAMKNEMILLVYPYIYLKCHVFSALEFVLALKFTGFMKSELNLGGQF